MDRRNFLRSATLAASLPPGELPMTNPASHKQQWYELRIYSFSSDTQRQLTETYLQQAYLPALNRAGSNPIGVFSDKQTGRLYGLIPFASIDAFAALEPTLARDQA